MTEAQRIHERNMKMAAEAQYEKDSADGVLSEYETCSSCLTVVLDSTLTATDQGRICRACNVGDV